ncbi:hypothetical protein ALC62_12186 [Cyphomyrmex costatus]|uniref:Odorant receptor n=1 Tax=Cyphomyrmex costatus TaxID=456900 RepID=A0A195CAD1_9HYME|nr:hypothetical protein ALC62_12186 [Cyphomyrmex costatus]
MSLTTTISPSVEFGLRAIGIWPGSHSILYRIFWTISLGLAQTFQFKYIIACIETANFLDLVDSVSTTLPYSLLCLKLIILWQNQRLFNDILTSMSRDWRNCDAIASDVRIMTNKAILSHRCSMLIIGVYSIAAVVYVSVIMEFNSINSESGKGELFLKMEFPFVYEFSPVYEIVMFVQFVQLLSNASSKSVANAAYEALWYNAKPSESRSVLILILRSQKRLTLTIGKFNDLSLEVFAAELPYLIDGLSTTLPYNLLFFKLVVLWVKNRLFIDILTAMSNDWSEYSNMYAMIDKAILAHRCSKLTIGVYSTAVLLYSTASINFRKQTNDSCRELLIKMELPFEFCESPIYEIVECVQFVHLMAVASAIGMLDALMVTLVTTNSPRRRHFLDIFYDVLAAMAADWREATNSEMDIMMNKANLSRRISNVIVGIHSVSFLCFSIEVLASYTNDYDADGIEIPVRAFALQLQLQSPLYELVMVLEFFHQWASSTTTGILNCLLITLSKMIGDAAYKSVWYDFTQ